MVLEASLRQSDYKPWSCLGITPSSHFPAPGHAGIPHRTELLLVSCEWCGISFSWGKIEKLDFKVNSTSYTEQGDVFA